MQIIGRARLPLPQQIAPCFPTYDTEGKREFRTVAMAIIQAMCDARLLPKEAAIRSGSILNVPEGVRCTSCVCIGGCVYYLQTVCVRIYVCVVNSSADLC